MSEKKTIEKKNAKSAPVLYSQVESKKNPSVDIKEINKKSGGQK